jgi:hypothetical protein
MERMLLLLAPASVLMVRPKPSVVVRRDGLERAVDAECGLGQRPPVPVFPFSPPKRRKQGNPTTINSFAATNF